MHSVLVWLVFVSRLGDARLLFALLEPAPQKFTYYIEFQNALTDRYEYCYLIEREPKCKFHSEFVVITLLHHLTVDLQTLERQLVKAEAVLADHCLEKAVVLVCLNKIYTGIDEKLALIDRFKQRLPIIVTTWSSSAASRYGLNYIPFAVNATEFQVDSISNWSDRDYDVYFSGDTNSQKYPMRPDLIDIFQDAKGLSFYIPNTRLNQTEYLRHLASAKMVLSTPGFPSTKKKPWFDLIGTRFYEVFATGSSLLLCQRSPYYAELGIIENETAIMFSSPQEALAVAKYYAKHEDKAMTIIKKAKKLVHDRHTWEARAEAIGSLVKKTKPIFSSTCCSSCFDPKVKAIALHAWHLTGISFLTTLAQSILAPHCGLELVSADDFLETNSSSTCSVIQPPFLHHTSTLNALTLPSTKFVYMLRDPFALISAAYSTHIYLCQEKHKHALCPHFRHTSKELAISELTKHLLQHQFSHMVQTHIAAANLSHVIVLRIEVLLEQNSSKAFSQTLFQKIGLMHKEDEIEPTLLTTLHSTLKQYASTNTSLYPLIQSSPHCGALADIVRQLGYCDEAHSHLPDCGRCKSEAESLLLP